MKKFILTSSLVFAFAYLAAFGAQFAGLISFNLFGLPALIGGAITSGIIGLVLSDYSRRPSFRVRKPQVAAAEAQVAQVEDPVTMWTYTTRNA